MNQITRYLPLREVLFLCKNGADIPTNQTPPDSSSYFLGKVPLFTPENRIMKRHKRISSLLEMKTLKMICIVSMPVLIHLSSCKKTQIDTSRLSNELMPCEWSDSYVIDSTFTNMEGEVSIWVSEQKKEYFHINFTNPATHIGILPCNIPDEFKKAGIKIRVSGHTMAPTGGLQLNVPALPAELTAIRRIQ